MSDTYGTILGMAREKIEKAQSEELAQKERLKVALRVACEEMAERITEHIQPEFITAQQQAEANALKWNFETSERSFGSSLVRYKATIRLSSSPDTGLFYEGDPEKKVFMVKRHIEEKKSLTSEVVSFSDLTRECVSERVIAFFKEVYEL